MKDLSDLRWILDIQFILFYMMGFLFMTYTNGIVTINFFDTYNPQEMYYGDPQNYQSLLSYREELEKQQHKIPKAVYFVYWILSPLFNISYGLWAYKKGLMISPKDLYIKVYIKFRK